MGYNLYSACHKCKKKIFHFRNEENKTILPFYKKHSKCTKEDIDNVQTVMDNNGTDQEWMYNNFGKTDEYNDDELQSK